MHLLPFRNISLTDRDRKIIRGLYESRLITLPQAAEIFFDGKYEVAKKRFQKLEHAGMLAKRPGWSPYKQAIYVIKPPALRFFVNPHSEYLDGYPRLTEDVARKRSYVKDSTVRHELAVMDIKASLYRGIRSVSRYAIHEFTTWPRLIEFDAPKRSGGSYTLTPDGFLELHEFDPSGELESVYDFFVEVDLSTEVRKVLTKRMFGYHGHLKQNGLASRFGSDPNGDERFPFRVLLVAKSEERRNSLADHIIRNNIHIPQSFIWLTTVSEVMETPCSPIWMSTGEYYRVTCNTPFDPTVDRDKSYQYVTNSKRDKQVAAGIHKNVLWDD